MTAPQSVTNRPRHTPATERDENEPSHHVTHPFATPANPRHDTGNSVTPPLSSQGVTDLWRSVTPARDSIGVTPTARPRHTASLTRITRKANEVECPTCGQPVLAGLDADRMAREAVINPTPITPAIELTEWAAGRPTYTYSPLRGEIDYRDHGSLTPRPDVHATHTCPKEDPLW